MRRLVVLCVLVLVLARPAAAQLQSEVVVSGLSSPVAFAQDPSLPDTQYVVEQGGRIRVVRGGQLQPAHFLDLTGSIAAGGERGLLGLAFAPDYATSGRVFVNFTNAAGHTVVARFVRSAADPRQANPATRFDLRWPDGQRFIAQPYSNHNGGDLQFGPDGRLYIGLGDGGSGSDPEHRAQNPSTLLGKMLRIDVSVGDADPDGYDVPSDNPFVSTPGYLPEIWAFGYRNPWRYSFDSFGEGATGALIVGDVGQSSWEEIDYEPAGRGGRNYGWRNREGAHDHVTFLPPAFTPLTDPLHEYGRDTGATVVGGYVYRGAVLPSGYRGRYFFADFVSARVWSLGLSIDGSGEATAADVQEHTAELGGSSALGNISAFGRDASGELYIVGYSAGEIRRITSPVGSSRMLMALEAPLPGALVQPFTMSGWAIDLAQTDGGTGVDTVHLWAIPLNGQPAVLLGAAYGSPRPDVAATYGPNYERSGYATVVSGLMTGSYRLVAFGRSTVTGGFEQSVAVDVTILTGPAMAIDEPASGAIVPARFSMSGWAVDRDAAAGTGIDAVHVWAYPSSGSPRFVGAATYGASRPDIGAAFGSRFTDSGWALSGSGLPPGAWTLVAFARSTVSRAFAIAATVAVRVQGGGLMVIDTPPPGPVTQPFLVAGWAVDLAAASGAGVAAVHVWAFPVRGGSPIFAGAAAVGGSRPDVGAVLGSQFTPSGYALTVASLPSGTFDLVVFAQSTVTGNFEVARVVRVEIQ